MPGRTILPTTDRIASPGLEGRRVSLPPRLAQRIIGVPLAWQPAHLDVLLNSGAPDLRTAQGFVSLPVDQGVAVAVLPVYGALLKRGTGDPELDRWFGITSTERLVRDFAALVADDTVGAIVLQIDSPGGEARGIFDLAAQIYAARGRKPIYAVADEWAYSAGYLLASAADRVVLPRTGGVGSIGVVLVRLDATGFDSQLGLRYHVLTSGARKADGNPHVAATTEELAGLQREVDRIAGMFIDAVATYRGLEPDAVRALEAATFHGEDAVTAGLADEVQTFEDTVLELLTRPATAGGTPPGRGERGNNMAHEVTPPATGSDPAAAAPVVNLDDYRQEGAAAERARVSAIVECCALAGKPELAGQFIAGGASEAVVRKALLEQKAADDTARATAPTQPAQHALATSGRGLNPNLVYERRRAAMQGRPVAAAEVK